MEIYNRTMQIFCNSLAQLLYRLRQTQFFFPKIGFIS